MDLITLKEIIMQLLGLSVSLAASEIYERGKLKKYLKKLPAELDAKLNQKLKKYHGDADVDKIFDFLKSTGTKVTLESFPGYGELKRQIQKYDFNDLEKELFNDLVDITVEITSRHPERFNRTALRELFGLSEKIDGLGEKVDESTERIIDKIDSLTPSQPSPTASPWNVPFLQNPNFIGRDREMAQLKVKLQQKKETVISQVITGMGGVGKTQLAVEYCHQFKTDYPGGVFWITGTTDILGEYATLVEKLGSRLAENMKVEDKCVHVKECFQQRDKTTATLLVLDNLDEKKPYDEIHPYLPTTGFCRILITTRRKDMGDGLSLDILPDVKALELLLKESTRENTDGNTAQNICFLLGNLPLAIEVAGKYLKKMTVVSFEEFYQKLTDSGLSHRCLDDGKILPNVDHIASVKATLSVHQELLKNSQIVKMLSAMTCFEPDSINPELLSLVCGMNWNKNKEEIWDLIINLRNYSLIEILPLNNRISIHRLMQEAVREKISDDQTEEIQIEYINQLSQWYGNNNQVDKTKIMSLESSHILKAAQAALKKNLWPQSYDLCFRPILFLYRSLSA